MRVARRGAAVLGAGALSGCGGPFSALAPAGASAETIGLLWWIIFWVSAAVFVVVSVLLVAVIRRPGRLADLAPSTWIVWGGLAFPGAVLVLFVGLALPMGESLLPSSSVERDTEIKVRASMWNWEFDYGQGRATSAGVLHLPAGEDVDLVVTSADVIHSFWVPSLGGKIDAVPGHENRIRLRAARPGVYGGICAEYCGTGHAGMMFRVAVRDAAGHAATLDGLGRAP
jgi:cytochrome c oxidase subunit 2